MFDFALSEFFLLGIIALIFLGPKELMILFKTLGKWMAKLKAMQAAFHHSMNAALEEDSPPENSHTERSDSKQANATGGEDE